MSHRTKMTLLILIMLFSFAVPLQPAAAQSPVVRGILFYSPTCPVCHDIMGDVLPDYKEQYGDSLEILNINVSTAAGQAIYQNAVEAFQITDNRIGVPTLIISSVVMVGRYEIPEYLTTIIETGLSADGYQWPEIPGLLEEIEANTFEYYGQEGSFGYEVTIWERFNQDPLANSLAVIVLLGMVYSLYRVLRFYNQSGKKVTPDIPNWTIPVISVIGLAVAGYLSFVEVSHTDAICGPVGDCNLVQQSEYSRLFGAIPIGILGIVAYVILLGAWVIQQYADGATKKQAVQIMWLVTIGGTIFSIYLTYLEPFVIGATCVWCIASAIAMTLLLWLTTFLNVDINSRQRRRGRRA